MITEGGAWRNWGRSESSQPRFTSRASSVDDVVETVRFGRDRGLTVKTVGASHSFTGIAAAPGVQLDVSAVDGLLAVDGNRVTLGAGTNLYQLPALLAPHGLALANMGDIDRQTIAGATSTGTHGTGAQFGGLATQIRAVTLVTAAGELLHVSETENAELLPAVTLALGALGVLVDVQIECVPAFLLHAVERPEKSSTVLAEWQQRLAENDHFEFYAWPHSDLVSTKSNNRLPTDSPRQPLGRFRGWFENQFMSNTVFSASLEMLRVVPALIPPMNRLSVKLEANREFTDDSPYVFATTRAMRFREMEYALPVDRVPEALTAVHALIERKGWRISFPIEVRASAADDLWLSTAHGRPTGYIAVHRFWKEDEREYFREVEAIMRDFEGRPHWGKMNARTADDLRPAYPHFDDFLAVRDRLDPDRLFTNDYLERVLGP
ncbi:D-arabinono-1,4-lactone oxidase [soil metagenome]